MPPLDRRFRGAFSPLALALLGCALALGAPVASAAGATVDAGLDADLAGVQAGARAADGAATQRLDLGAPVDGLPLGQALEPASLPPLRGPASSAGPAHALPGPLDRPEVQLAAGASVAAGAWALASRAGLAAALPLFAPLYSRLDRGQLLNHPVRRGLMRAIGQDPGVNISDLHGRFDLGWGSLLYHLQRLEAQGLVVSHRWGRSRRYFLNQRGLEVRAEGIRALKAPNARQLAEVIAAQPGRTQEELAGLLGLSKSVISKYAKRLSDARLVQRETGRNCLRLFPTSELRELLHTVAPPAPALPHPAPAVADPVPSPERAPDVRGEGEGPAPLAHA